VQAWGDTTRDGSLSHPAGIAVDAKGRVCDGDLFVAEFAARRVERLRILG
jgi:hypothetical protein